MKKKTILLLSLAAMLCTSATAQTKEFSRGIFNRIGVNAGVGTEGIHLSVAGPCTNLLEFSVGVNMMPGIKVKGKVNVNQVMAVENNNYVEEIDLEGNFARTTIDFKVNCYPFGGNSPFFVAAGFSFGGATMAKVTGHSESIRQKISENPSLEGQIVAELDKYSIKFDKNGDVKGELRVNDFRPYLGLGVGRMITKHRVGFRAELGCQFMGKIKVFQDRNEVNINDTKSGDETLSNIVKKLTVYPVLKIGITTRIL